MNFWNFKSDNKILKLIKEGTVPGLILAPGLRLNGYADLLHLAVQLAWGRDASVPTPQSPCTGNGGGAVANSGPRG
jgi:hypothetical protein